MHDVENKGLRVTLACAGLAASLMLLLASAIMNFRFGYSWGKTDIDGMIYGGAAAAADVFLAATPFFFFAAKKNSEWTKATAALAMWAVFATFAAVSAIGHAASNRFDVTSARTVTATSYKDIRTELEAARQERGFIPQHRPEATVRAELERHKVNRFWTTTNECTEAAGKQSREYCATYQTLNAELGAAMQAARLTARIDALTARSDKAVELSATTVHSEADPQAKVISLLSGYQMQSVQGAITLLAVSMILLGASCGPYVCTAVLRGRRPDFTQPSVTAPPEMLAEVLIGHAQPPLIEPPPAAAGLPAPLSRPEPTPEGRALLARIAFPKVKPDGDLRAMTEEEKDTVGMRMLAWLTANGIRGEWAPDQVWNLYLEFFAAWGVVPMAERIAKPALEAISKGRRRYASRELITSAEGKKTVWTIKLPDYDELHGLLDKAGFPPPPKPGKGKPAEEAAPAKGSVRGLLLPFAEAPPAAAPPDAPATAQKAKAPVKGLAELQRYIGEQEKGWRQLARLQKAAWQAKQLTMNRKKQGNRFRRARAA